MTKRSRPEEWLVELSPREGEENCTAEVWNVPEGEEEGLKEKFDSGEPLGKSTGQEGITDPEQLESPEVAADNESLEDLFWSLLSQAGYTLW